MTDARDPDDSRRAMSARSFPGGDAPVTQAQREAAVERLSSAFAHDVIELAEFERRVADAYRAGTRADLVRLTADLPADTRGVAGLPIAREAGDAAAPMPTRIRSVFSSVERSGYATIPPRVEIVARFANIELDLRSAWFLPGITEIDVRSVFGNVEIRLPPEVVIENDGDWVISSVSVQRADSGDASSTSIVRITGRAVLSNLEVSSRPSRRRR